jgi:hypothetical protein
MTVTKNMSITVITINITMTEIMAGEGAAVWIGGIDIDVGVSREIAPDLSQAPAHAQARVPGQGRGLGVGVLTTDEPIATITTPATGGAEARGETGAVAGR